MRIAINKPLVVSAIPATATGPIARPVSAKRVHRLRLNWFVVGSIFGVGISFLMNLIVTAVIMPEYQQVMMRHGEIVLAEVDKSPVVQQANAASPIAPPTPAPDSYPRTLALEVGRGDTLVGLLIHNHVQETDAHNVAAALRDTFNTTHLKVGQKISVTLARHETIGDKAAVKELAIRLPNLSMVELQRLQNGQFNVAATKEELSLKPYRAMGKVKSSFSQAANDAGIPMATMNDLIKAYSYDVDFQRDIHPGDTIEVLLDRKVSKDGLVGGYGDVRYAALTLQGKKQEIYRFKDGYGDYAWFDAKGNSIKKSLLRTPIDGARITSGFGMREHPILGYSKFHRGVDFGAPQGTPIFAAGDGVVEQRGWANGYGNFVLIKHNATYETAYGHCARFGNIKVGGRVKQGQIIAYVGMTGLATGPHLHYEVRDHGDQVNPVARQFNMASGLTGKQLAAFKASKTSIAKELAALSNPQPQAQLASR